MIENTTEFVYKHQTLALQVARLPILRDELIDANNKVANGFLGNAAKQRDEYNNCVRWINELAKMME